MRLSRRVKVSATVAAIAAAGARAAFKAPVESRGNLESALDGPPCAACAGDRRGRVSPLKPVFAQAAAPHTTDTPAQFSEHELRRVLGDVVGSEYVWGGNDSRARPYSRGARIGGRDDLPNNPLFVVFPGSLHDTVEVISRCSRLGVAIVPQGANTGLTGGSVPRSHRDTHHRPTVVLSTSRLRGVVAIDGGERVLCLAGTGIRDLAEFVSTHGRESHSVLGSMFLNPTVGAGVALGSGGTQLRKGPVYTERALWCKINSDFSVEVKSSLGIRTSLDRPFDGTTPEDLDHLQQLVETQTLGAEHVMRDCDRKASDTGYASRLRDDSYHNVARYNADVTGPEFLRSEGKVFVLATVHDTFEKPVQANTFWISCDTFEDIQKVRTSLLSADPASAMPAAMEYMNRDSYDVVDGAGRILCHLLAHLGTGKTLSWLWSVKGKIDSLPIASADVWVDKILFWFNGLVPCRMPRQVQAMARDHGHHLLVVQPVFRGDRENERREALRARVDALKSSAQVYECDPREAAAVSDFRFAAAPAFRTWCVGKNLEGLSIDYALPLNYRAIPDLESAAGVDSVPTRMRYAHLGCNVIHEDIAFPLNTDVVDFKHPIKAFIESEGGRLPAEHGHGTEYAAPEATAEKWKKLDPTNSMNPGVGQLPVEPKYGK